MISTHDTPVGSAPTDGADELIKDFGITAPAVIRFGIVSAASRFQPSPGRAQLA
ncbi:hypothetical protein [Tardiphaga sp. 862_B3_N1_1]|uniref:hypothetical protein n=1 Tax=Tardiphaga sp. 862_B3_N1_1 TaxID=3240763 RepID=UPI003F8A0B33